MNLTHEQTVHLSTIANAISVIGESLRSFAAASLASEPEFDLRDHYSQEARDRRQYPVLSLVRNAPGGKVHWNVAKVHAFANGYEPAGVGGFFTGPNALLRYTDDTKQFVEITGAGLQRMQEIETRGLVPTAV